MSNGWGGAAFFGSLLAIGIWKSLGDEQKDQAKKFGSDLRDVIGESLREQEERKRLAEQALLKEAAEREKRRAITPPLLPVPQSTSPVKKSKPLFDLKLDTDKLFGHFETGSQWSKLIVPPGVILILGKRGAGKSALAYRLLEEFRYRLTPYVVAAPSSANQLLPEWIGIESELDHVPPNSIALIDEAYLGFHSRESQAKASIEMSRILNLSRQRQLTLIFVTQEARQVDRNIASSADVIIFKEPSPLQLEFERRELKPITEKAIQAFGGIQKDTKSWAYVYSPDADFSGMVQSKLPSFWTDQMSRSFANPEAKGTRRPKKLSREEKIQRAKELRSNGWTLTPIATELGVSKATVINYLKGYPYKKAR
ncbi:MAG: helix-turn-helix domain-containing protein [Chloroflexi bacterium]|nr:helix-turn-helix domain-containing protein [Chloroflexota bacterium]